MTHHSMLKKTGKKQLRSVNEQAELPGNGTFSGGANTAVVEENLGLMAQWC